MRKNLITIAALAVTMLAASAHAGEEVIRSASATKAQLTEYWSRHDNHGLRAVNTTATTLHTLSGRPYAVFTVDAAQKPTGLPVQLAMIYDVNAKVMYGPLAQPGQPVSNQRRPITFKDRRGQRSC